MARINNPETNRFLIADGGQLVHIAYETQTNINLDTTPSGSMSFSNVPAGSHVIGSLLSVLDDSGYPYPVPFFEFPTDADIWFTGISAGGVSWERLTGGKFDDPYFDDTSVIRFEALVFYIESPT